MSGVHTGMRFTQLNTMSEMTLRVLINEDGSPFDSEELGKLRSLLDALQTREEREGYRNQNANEIAKHPSGKLLIVSGPGTGKSFLFMQKIKHWLSNGVDGDIFVTSFVRKLVADLQNDVNKLDEEQRNRITVSTLHKFARSIVEKNHGTSQWRFQPYFKIIAESWKEVVWEDVLAFFDGIRQTDYSRKKFEYQLHNDQLSEDGDWPNLIQKYFELCRFYNAAGFADLISRAKDALNENEDLNSNACFIIDEYQDFNASEDALLETLTSNATSILIVGDDDQVLYEELKSGKAELIRTRYSSSSITNAMLPFCGRSDYHITKAAAHFIQSDAESECIEKIYLPLEPTSAGEKVKVVACAQPVTVVDFIQKFIEEHESQIKERKAKIESG